MSDLLAPPTWRVAAPLLALVDRLLAAPDLASYARLACEGIGELVPGLSVSYNELDPQTGRAHALIVPDPGPGWFRTFQPPFEAYQHQNPLVERVVRTGDTRVLAWGDPGIGGVEGTELDEAFYRPNGIRSQLVLALPAPPGVLIAFAVNRGEEGFTAAERELLSLLRPHLVHAYRAVQLRAERQLLSTVVAGHGWAVVLVDGAGRVLRASPDAAAAADRYGLPAATGGQLAAGPLAEIGAVLAGYDPMGPAVPVPIVGPLGTPVAVVVPSVVGPHVVLLRCATSTTAGLIAAAGLTARQAEVALGLIAGESNAAIARRLGISSATVRKHLEAIFDRLGVNSRAAVVAKLLSLS